MTIVILLHELFRTVMIDDNKIDITVNYFFVLLIHVIILNCRYFYKYLQCTSHDKLNLHNLLFFRAPFGEDSNSTERFKI